MKATIGDACPHGIGECRSKEVTEFNASESIGVPKCSDSRSCTVIYIVNHDYSDAKTFH